jgi:signal transduction histidine kinase
VNEVSCRAFEVFLREARARRVPAERLIEGSSLTLAVLRDKHERVEWSEAVRFWANAGRLFGEDQLFAIGGRYVKSPMVRPLAAVARLLFSVGDVYRWLGGSGAGPGKSIFTCIEHSFRMVTDREFVFELTLAPGYPPSPEFFLTSQGALAAIPVLLGEPPATVEMELFERGARYSIRLAKPSRTGWLRRLFALPRNLLTAGQELKEANEVLFARNQELEAARKVLADQAQQLQTANTIGGLVHGELNLDRTLTTVARALVEVAGFAAAAAEVDVFVDGERISRHTEVGTIPEHGTAAPRTLDVRGRCIGAITVWRAEGGADPGPLLELVLPTVALAVDNALSYRALADYRGNLEARVKERTRELEQAQAARDRLFANINHEIRTPLSIVLVSSALLRENEAVRAQPDALSQLTRIEFGGRKLVRLVDELLLLAAGQERKLKINLRASDLAQLVQAVAAAWRAVLEAHGIVLEVAVPPSCTARIDTLVFERVLANLLSNAAKFTPAGGRVTVALGEGAEGLELVVRDTGIGIDDELRSRLFGRFEQGRASSTPGQGSGIGLSLVKQLVDAHGGSIVAEDTPGGGATFRIRLPRCDDARAEPPEPLRMRASDFGFLPPVGRADRRERPGPHAATVLLAEDDRPLAESIAEMFGAELRVLVAHDGQQALELARAHSPDLLITDIHMPGLDGLELSRRFRALPNTKLSPVLVLTAFGETGDLVTGFAAGAIDYIVKPFDPVELRARVRAHLEHRQLLLRLHETEKLASLGTLSAGLAHEIRNPANAIVNAIEPLRRALPQALLAPGTPTAQLLQVLEGCSVQIGSLARQLLGFRQDGRLECQTHAFADIATRACSLTAPAFRATTLEQDLRYRGTLRCAAPLIVQVMANLLQNGAEAAGEGGWVRLTSEASQETLIVDVADSGGGVPQPLRERVFEPFFTTKARGTGLGLSLSRDIALRHGGSLSIVDDEAGSRFRMVLPLGGAA